MARPRAPGSGLRKPTQADSAPRTDEVLDMLQITYKRNGGHGNRDHRERKHWDDEDPVRSLRKLLPKAEDKIHQPKPDARTLKKPDDETPADDDDMFCDCDILNDLDLFKRLEDGKAQLKKDLGSSLYSKINELMKGIQEKDDCDVVGEVQKVLEILGSQKEDMFASIFFLAMNDSLLGSPTGKTF
nr:hypothetical protein BaRGS_018011 [Batillaria attramentaria]